MYNINTLRTNIQYACVYNVYIYIYECINMYNVKICIHIMYIYIYCVCIYIYICLLMYIHTINVLIYFWYFGGCFLHPIFICWHVMAICGGSWRFLLLRGQVGLEVHFVTPGPGLTMRSRWLNK